MIFQFKKEKEKRKRIKNMILGESMYSLFLRRESRIDFIMSVCTILKYKVNESFSFENNKFCN